MASLRVQQLPTIVQVDHILEFFAQQFEGRDGFQKGLVLESDQLRTKIQVKNQQWLLIRFIIHAVFQNIWIQPNKIIPESVSDRRT